MTDKENLQKQIDQIDELLKGEKDGRFDAWRGKTSRLLGKIFTEESSEKDLFDLISYSLGSFTNRTTDEDRHNAYLRGLDKATHILKSFLDEIPLDGDQSVGLPEMNLNNLFEKFQTIANIFARGHEGSGTFEIKKEKDIQLILLGLLQLYYDDVRPEESVKSHSTSNSKVDFYIPKEKLFIEVKYNLDNIKFRKEVHDDINIYKADEKCERMIFFLYDPHYKIKGAISTENDFHQDDSFPVKVFIRPQ